MQRVQADRPLRVRPFKVNVPGALVMVIVPEGSAPVVLVKIVIWAVVADTGKPLASQLPESAQF